MFSKANTLFALLATSTGLAFAVNPVTIKGPNFLDENGKRVKIVGIDYQPGGEAGYDPTAGKDVLSDPKTCLRDAALMQQLGINTVRVYNLDPTVDHDECMSIFNAVGMYMILDVNSPFESLNRDDPASTYTDTYLTRVFGIVENFMRFPNTMGFFAANEVINNLAHADENPQFIRALVRDIKNYIANHSDRPIGVGYSAADVRPLLDDTWSYLQCSLGEGDMSQSDFFGLNSYSWCGTSNIQQASYDDLQKLFEPSAIPVFFSEYGCNDVTPRVFTEVPALYGPQMTAMSGGLVYQWTEDISDFGLVEVSDKDQSVTLRTDFDNLQAQYNKLPPASLAAGDPINLDAAAPRCDSNLISHPEFSKSFKLPSPPSGVNDLIENGIPEDAAHRGQLVDVADTASPYVGVTTTGDQIQPFEINPLPSGTVNTPSDVDTTAENEGNGSPTTGGASESSSGAAVPGRALSDVAVGGSGLLALMAVVFGMY